MTEQTHSPAALTDERIHQEAVSRDWGHASFKAGVRFAEEYYGIGTGAAPAETAPQPDRDPAASKSHDVAREAGNACARLSLVTALHSLASDFENALYAFKDDAEALKKAKGDIEHARSVAAKFNQNGPGCSDFGAGGGVVEALRRAERLAECVIRLSVREDAEGGVAQRMIEFPVPGSDLAVIRAAIAASKENKA